MHLSAMLTATTKALLGPIADAVAQLIVITAQAELTGTGIPDLTDVAGLVAAQVHELADIGSSLIDGDALKAETNGQVDVIALQAGMMKGCEEGANRLAAHT